MLGKRLAEARRRAGLNQAELAAALGDHVQSMVSHVEAGRRFLRHDDIVRAARELNTSTDYLLCLTDDPTPAAQRIASPSAGSNDEYGEMMADHIGQRPDWWVGEDEKVGGLPWRLKAARGFNEWTLPIASEHLGIPVETISAYESGAAEVTARHLKRLAMIYKTTLSWLLMDELVQHPLGPVPDDELHTTSDREIVEREPNVMISTMNPNDYTDEVCRFIADIIRKQRGKRPRGAKPNSNKLKGKT